MTQPVPMTMKSLVADYLDVRRAAGFALVHEESQLRAFALFADQRNHSGTITTELALEWAQASRYGRQITAARRVEVLRPFMKHCVSLGRATGIVSRHACGPAHRRLAPHIYTGTGHAFVRGAATGAEGCGSGPLHPDRTRNKVS